MDFFDQSSDISSQPQNSDSDWRIELPLNLLCDSVKDRDLLKRPDDEWLTIFEKSVFFQGKDPLIWGSFLACVYLDPDTNKFGAFFIDKVGTTHFPNVNFHDNSVYGPAVLNLSNRYKDSNVRKVLACSLLEKYATTDESIVQKITDGVPLKFEYDQTHSGDLANGCKMVEYCTPGNLGKSIMLHGLICPRSVQSLLVDVVYENKPESIDANNELVFYLGEQLEQLFDPLTEYSPEQTERVYTTPDFSPEEQTEKDEPLINSICQELLTLQTNFTLSIIEFLQKFLIPLRIDVLNEDIPTLSAAKLNRLFPPTIDEVTRINCIFLDALKSATPYGSIEVLKACSVTVPYFYKAYSRHEAATKNFSKDIKLFLQKFKQVIPNSNTYTEMKIETIIRGPQEKLMKIKLILERLWQCKTWSTPEIENDAQKNYTNIMEIVDSFGKLDSSTMSAYNTRVFTPSGKILTELAKGWPLELQYKWLKRRIVGVFDVIDADNNSRRDLLVIFSDYIVILSIVDAEKYYSETDNKPLISDVLMNSLINEVALPSKIPKLQVVSHCYIDRILTSTTKDNSIILTFLDPKQPESFVYKLASSKMKASHIEELCTKATILEKVTAFHLFKSNRCNFNIYFTAHELEAYQNETIKSRFTLFLNCPPNIKQLEEHELDLAFFATLDTGKISLTKLTSEGTSDNVEVTLDELVTVLTKELMSNYGKYTYSFKAPFYNELLRINEQLTKLIGHDFNLVDIHDAPSIVTTPVVNDKTNGFQPVHKKDKSYGTITTFRSSVSDFKDNLLSNNAKSSKANKKFLKSNKDKSQTESKQSKLGGFISKLFSVFRKRKSPSKSQKRVVTKKDAGLARNISKDLPPISVPKKKGERVGSVIHNKNITPDPRPHSDNPYILSSSNSFKTVDSSEASCEDANNVSALKNNAKPKSIYTQHQQARQSQVFNDDLFGDIVAPTSSVHDKNRADTIVQQDDRTKDDGIKDTSVELSGGITPCSDVNNSFTSLEQNTRNVITIESTPTSITQVDKEQLEGQPASSTYPSKDEDNTKSPIFPKINKYEIPKINFTKSPSFAELFKEMRMVLDESDEVVNWRRLSSEVSLNEKYAIHIPTDKNLRSNKRLSAAVEVPEQDELSFHKDDVKSDQRTLDTGVTLTKSSKLSGNFNVIKTSPVKIITRNELTMKRTSRSSNLNDDPPSFYTEDMSKNARLVELTFHSQEDLPESPFYTPQTEETKPSEHGHEETNVDHLVPPESTIKLPTETTKSQDEPAPLLDDLEFSFFHMSFDNTNNTSTRESTMDTGDVFENKNVLPRKVAEPVFYKFDNFTKSNESFFSAHDKVHPTAVENDDEPIWVSPSKLDMFDISNKSDTFFKSLQPPASKKAAPKAAAFGALTDENNGKHDEPSFLRDSSYDYLGGVLAEDDETKPTRLQFSA